MKKLALIFILILVCLLPCAALAEGHFSYSFETPTESALWSGGVFDGSNYFENGYALYVYNPFGEVKNNLITHVLDYKPSVTLEGGKTYKISGYVFNPLSAYSPSPRSSAVSERNSNTIILTVNGIGDEWAEFSSTFYVGNTGEYNLRFHFADGLTDFGFFVDEIVLTDVNCQIASVNIQGQDEILIPATDSIKTYYRPYLLTTENEAVDILSPDDIHFAVSDTEGVYFSYQDFSLNITPDATAGSYVTMDCALRNQASLSPTTLLISLTDNMIDDGGINGEQLLWSSTSPITADGGFIAVPTNDYGEFGYFVSLKYETSQILMEDVLYVVRARIKSDSKIPFSAIHAKNSAEVKDGTLYFSIKDISGEEWFDVFAAFTPQQSGIYDIALNLCSMYDCTIYIDDISLSCEAPAAEYVTLHAPGNIAIPVVPTEYPVSALLRDQMGNIIPSENIEISLLEQDYSIYLSGDQKTITVNPDTPAGVYTLLAIYIPDPSITAKLDFTVSFDFIGDGGFENTLPNEWWMATSPFGCDFYMRDDGFSRRGLVNCRGNYFILLNNSYVHLREGTPYVFNSAFAAPIDCTGTLFLEKTDGNVLPLSQFFIGAGATLEEKHAPELFLAEEDAVGRLFIYIESNNGEPFSVYTDNLSLKSASISAINPRVTGLPYVNGTADADFILFNNIAENDDASLCAINWYVSDSIHGNYTEHPYGGKTIYFDTTFLNKYVYFEITPICPVTGFSGEVARSVPVLITYQPTDSVSVAPLYTPVIKWEEPSQNYFTDIDGHWGSKYINTLAHSQVVAGKGNDRFAPNDTITRAEFSKMLSCAFSVNIVAENIVHFEDVTQNDWFYDYTTSLYLAGIINGTSENTFSPLDTLTREQAVTMAVKLYEKATSSIVSMDNAIIPDIDEISDWAKIPTQKALKLKLVQGYPDGRFSPKDNLTRAQAAKIIYNLAYELKK